MRKKSGHLILIATYFIMIMITAAAIATPPAIAANLLDDTDIGALAMILSVASLMLVLVIEIWRFTAKNANFTHKNQMPLTRPKKHIL